MSIVCFLNEKSAKLKHEGMDQMRVALAGSPPNCFLLLMGNSLVTERILPLHQQIQLQCPQTLPPLLAFQPPCIHRALWLTRPYPTSGVDQSMLVPLKGHNLLSPIPTKLA